jgi:hypothetical protein
MKGLSLGQIKEHEYARNGSCLIKFVKHTSSTHATGAGQWYPFTIYTYPVGSFFFVGGNLPTIFK